MGLDSPGENWTDLGAYC